MASASVPPRILLLNPRDNVAVAIRALAAGEAVAVGGQDVVTLDAIPFGHKLALMPLPEGGAVVKYGEVIGLASAPIARGAHVHVHNVVSARLPGTG